jgi:hypothetical protein
MIVLERADHMHFVDDVEKSHEGFRTMPTEGDLARIQADMRPIADLCTGDEAAPFDSGRDSGALQRHVESAGAMMANHVALENARNHS